MFWELSWVGWVLLFVAVVFVVWDMAAVWAALRVSAASGSDERLLAKLPADGDDYTYPQREERLYDTRTYDQRTDERIDALQDEILQLEDAVRKLLLRLEALEERERA